MYKIINKDEFIKGFDEMNRSDNFSIEGRESLYDYLTQIEDELDDSLEFDPIALCCEFSEYESFEELQKNYSEIQSRNQLEEKTLIIDIYDIDEEHKGLIIQDF